MMRIMLGRGSSPRVVSLYLPNTPADIGKVFAELDNISTGDPTIIAEINSPVDGLSRYLKKLDLDTGDDFDKLHRLAEKVSTMKTKECWIFSGALSANSINGIDDVLSVANSIHDYILIPNVSSDAELGRYIAVSSQINGDPRFPEESWPYLDFAKIGSEYYADHRGAYTFAGYVTHKDTNEAKLQSSKQKDGALIILQLETSSAVCILRLPAEDEDLDAAMDKLGISDFSQAKVEKIEFTDPFLSEHIPHYCNCVGDANDLALSIDEMKQHDGMLLKYLSILAVCKPLDVSEALGYAFDIDDYERVPDDPDEYGRAVLRHIGADDEIIDTIDGYMDFAALGTTSMKEHGVRRTDFGLIRRCSSPFPEESSSMQFCSM